MVVTTERLSTRAAHTLSLWDSAHLHPPGENGLAGG